MPHRRSLLVLALGAFALGTDGFVIGGVLPTLAADLDVSLGSAGLLVTAFAIAYAVGAPVLSVLLGQVERRRVVGAGLVGFAAANVLAAFAPSYALLMVARVAAALAAGAFMPSASAIAATIVPEEFRGRALALVLTGMSAANVVGVPLGTLIGDGLDWRATFLFVAALGAVAALGVRALLPAVPAPPVASLAQRARVAVRPQTWPVLIQSALAMAGAFAVFTYIAPILATAAGIHGSGLSLALVLFGAAAVAGNGLGGAIADRRPATKVAIGGMAVLTLTFVALALATAHETAVVALAAIAVWGVAGWSFTPAQQHRLVASAPENPPVVLSLSSLANYGGMAAGGALGGLALHAGPAAVAWTGAGLSALAALTVTAQLAHARAGRSRAATGRLHGEPEPAHAR